MDHDRRRPAGLIIYVDGLHPKLVFAGAVGPPALDDAKDRLCVSRIDTVDSIVDPEFDLEPDEVIDRWYADIRNYGLPDAVLDFWRSLGNTHLLFHEEGANFIREDDTAYTDADWVMLEELLLQLELEDDIVGKYKLYSLRSEK